MKSASLLIPLTLLLTCSGMAQSTEHLTVDWPPEYNWQVVNRANNGTDQTITIIPGNETARTATIVGTIGAHKGVRCSSVDEIIARYKGGMDTGSVLVVIERSAKKKVLWVLFSVETPKTDKYPEPESDLYYAVQGDYALYENYVAIKRPTLDTSFIQKWSAIFMTGKVAK